MGRHKANGRKYMFACRLSEEEYEHLTNFLSMSGFLTKDKSLQFREILNELNGKLIRDKYGELAILKEETEIIEEELEPQPQREKEFKFPDLSRMK